MDDAKLLDTLAPTAQRLLDRHLGAAREWYPHDLVPWEQVSDEPLELPPGVQSALLVNTLTEDGLPYYFAAIHGRFGEEGPWWDWARRWTAEEGRHGMALHDYLAVTRALDLDELERLRLSYISLAGLPADRGVVDAFTYLSLQELATRIAHANTARQLPDAPGRRLVATVAADEHLHHLFYRDLVTASLAVDPEASVLAIDEQIRHFSMPGHLIPNFAGHARAIARAGIYSSQIFLDSVVVPNVFDTWHVDTVALPPGPGAEARERLLRFIERLQKIAPRLSGATSEPRVGA